MKKKILFVSEANEKVASGHVFECIECIQYFRANKHHADLLVNQDMPEGLKQRLPDNYLFYSSDIQMELNILLKYIREKAYEIIVFNLREIKNEFLVRLKKKTNAYIICIDEFGNRPLKSDMIINPMIDENYWYYDTDAVMYCGEKYLMLPRSLQKYHEKEKNITSRIHTVTVSMGGVDIKNSTAKVAKWLLHNSDLKRINLVLGAGYPYKEELQRFVERETRISLYQNILFLSDLFYESDLAICAGGNTLHELAVIGTPAIVIPTMSHERKNGKAYQKRGFSLCGELSENCTLTEFQRLFDMITSQEVRYRMSVRGKEIADGKGCERVYRIITNI